MSRSRSKKTESATKQPLRRRIVRIIPFVFIGTLLIVTIFFGGIFYGRNVERANIIIEQVISLTPAPTEALEPTQAPPPEPLTYATQEIAECNIAMTLPSSIEITEESRSALLTQDGFTVGVVSCDEEQTAFQQDLRDPAQPPEATSSVTLRSFETTVVASTAASFTHLKFDPRTGTDSDLPQIEILIQPDLLPLITDTIVPLTE